MGWRSPGPANGRRAERRPRRKQWSRRAGRSGADRLGTEDRYREPAVQLCLAGLAGRCVALEILTAVRQFAGQGIARRQRRLHLLFHRARRRLKGRRRHGLQPEAEAQEDGEQPCQHEPKSMRYGISLLELCGVSAKG